MIRRLLPALRASLAGLGAVLVAVALAVPASATQRALLLGSVRLVLIVELLNSAVEAAVDRISSERHPLSGRAKDLGSAAVLVALVLCALVWGLVLYDVLV